MEVYWTIFRQVINGKVTVFPLDLVVLFSAGTLTDPIDSTLLTLTTDGTLQLDNLVNILVEVAHNFRILYLTLKVVKMFTPRQLVQSCWLWWPGYCYRFIMQHTNKTWSGLYWYGHSRCFPTWTNGKGPAGASNIIRTRRRMVFPIQFYSILFWKDVHSTREWYFSLWGMWCAPGMPDLLHTTNNLEWTGQLYCTLYSLRCGGRTNTQD